MRNWLFLCAYVRIYAENIRICDSFLNDYIRPFNIPHILGNSDKYIIVVGKLAENASWNLFSLSGNTTKKPTIHLFTSNQRGITLHPMLTRTGVIDTRTGI